jgi:putative chitinase
VKLEAIDVSKIYRFSDLGNDPELCSQVQQALANEGLLGTVDGIYGPDTQNALVRFKWNHKLTGGNNIGAMTAQYLQRALSAGRSLLVSLEQASKVYGSQLYPAELADLNDCLSRFGITAIADIRMFLAQTAHESGGLRWLKELATGDAYEWRDDLGNTQAGDGRRFKGAGVIQLTGRANYQAFADFINDQGVMQGCDYVAGIYPFSSAGFWWMNNGVSAAIANGADIYAVTRIVNGGQNGIDDRIAYYDLACRWIKG